MNIFEAYRYPRPGLRGEKTDNQGMRVRYLPGLELRQQTGPHSDFLVIHLHSVRMRCKAQHYQLRYGSEYLNHHLSLELDGKGRLVTQETYFPFGGTAQWVTRRVVDHGKMRRYGGKERDACGMINYGFRYYIPWLMRWINPDPIGILDGMNLLRMCRNNPATFGDIDGRIPEEENDSSLSEWSFEQELKNAIARLEQPDPVTSQQAITPQENAHISPPMIVNSCIDSACVSGQNTDVQGRDEINSVIDINNVAVEKNYSYGYPSINKVTCNLCNRWVNIENMPKHYVTQHGALPHACRVPGCGERFAQVDMLVTHREQVHSLSSCICKVCEAIFTNSHGLSVHNVRHLDKPKVRCSVCNKEFRRKCDLKRHMKGHADEKPYKCNLCEKGFTRQDNLKKHLTKHSNKRPFICPWPDCGTTFKHQSYLSAHNKSFHT